MKKFVGTKVIEAEPMTRGEYAKLSGRNSILTEKGETEADKGYHVRYADGYESWSPADAFEAAGYIFEELYEADIKVIGEDLISKGYDIPDLVERITAGHNSRCYFEYKI